MSVPDSFVPYENQGPFLEHVGPFHVRADRVGGTLAFADCSLTVDGRKIVRARAVWSVAD